MWKEEATKILIQEILIQSKDEKAVENFTENIYSKKLRLELDITETSWKYVAVRNCGESM